MTKEASIYNIIYSNLGEDDVLAIVKIKSSENNQRFLLAYDDEYFKKKDIIYLINYIFSKNNVI